MIEYTTHKATELQEAMGGEGLYYVGCDICSLKASLSQGREVERDGKGTPELTDADLLTSGSGGKGVAKEDKMGNRRFTVCLTI
jgi:hypothetical protein